MNSDPIPFLSSESVASFKFNTHQTLLSLVANTANYGIAFTKIYEPFAVDGFDRGVSECWVSYEMTAHMRTFIVTLKKLFYLHTETNTPVERIFVGIRSYDLHSETEVVIDSETALTFGILRTLIDLGLVDSDVLAVYL